MIEDEETQAGKRDAVNGAEDTGSSSQPEGFPAHRTNEQGGADGPADGSHGRQTGPGNFLGRLTVNEWLTFLVGVGSLVVSYLTYQNATDTSDLKAAVGNLTNLASESRRQADAMQIQARAMQGQMEQLALAQRGWLAVSDFKFHGINVFPVGSGVVVFAKYFIANIGHSPVRDIFIKSRLFIKDVDQIDDAAVRFLCKHKKDADVADTVNYSTTVLPGQREMISGFPSSGAEFSRPNGMSGLDQFLFEARKSFGFIPILAGCVSYKTALDENWHHTGFAFQAGLQTEDIRYQASVYPGVLVGIPIDINRKGPVPVPERLWIGPFSAGNFAD